MGPTPASIGMDIDVNHLSDLAKLALVMRVYVTPAMEAAGQKLRAAAIDAIRLQQKPGGGSWEALTPAHKNWKKKQGFSEAIYTMTGTYMNNIASVYDPVSMTLEVGVFRGIMHASVASTSGATGIKSTELAEIASVLEYGYAALRIPARPLWRPLLEVEEHSIKTRVGIALAAAMKHVTRHMPPAPGGSP